NARLRCRALTVHRLMGRTYVVAVIAGGAAGFVLALRSEQGIVTHAGFGLLAILWVFSTIQAYRLIRAGDDVHHREWMIRSFSLTFAAVMLRNILPIELVSGVPFPIAYRIVSWACWVPNLVVAEWIIRRRPAAMRAGATAAAIVALGVIAQTT